MTLDNALKMLMVKSPNDVAVTVAEGVSGSVEAFADEMNAAAQHLGLHELHFVNPNGLHDPEHVSSARDMAMIARALLKEFPEQADLFAIGALQLGNQIITNHNGLLGRYPGADGMKTGFTCAAGFNVVASANHYGRRLIVVVLGSPSAKTRNQEAADLFDRGFAMGGGAGSLEFPAARARGAPNANICLHRSAAALAAAEEDEPGSRAAVRSSRQGAAIVSVVSVGRRPGEPTHTVLSDERPHFDPVPVFHRSVPGWKGPVLAARPTARGDSRAAGRRQRLCRRQAPAAQGDSPGHMARRRTRLRSSSARCARRRSPMGRGGFETRRSTVSRQKTPAVAKAPAPRETAKSERGCLERRT